MYCVGCGSTLPAEAQFCQRCGKRSIPDEPNGEPNSQTTANKVPDGSGSVSTDAQDAQDRLVSEKDEPEAQLKEGTAESVKAGQKAPPRHANPGSITLGIAALICLVLGAVQGFIPIFMLEGLAFAGVAWFCAVKWPLSEAANVSVLVFSLLLGGLVGVTLDQDTISTRYRYLSQGSAQFRIDERAGRTDRLYSGGWSPVAYDRAPEELDALALLWKVNMTDGSWESPIAGGRICFAVENTSEYVLKAIDIQVSIAKSNDPAAKDESGFIKVDPGKAVNVKLQSEFGGLIPPGGNLRMCGPAPRNLSSGETWSYTLQHYYGWKR